MATPMTKSRFHWRLDDDKSKCVMQMPNAIAVQMFAKICFKPLHSFRELMRGARGVYAMHANSWSCDAAAVRAANQNENENENKQKQRQNEKIKKKTFNLIFN